VKTIGLVGGMSWESSAVYYRDLNLGMRERLGGLSSPKLALTTVDFAEVTHLEDDERWDQVGALLADAIAWVATRPSHVDIDELVIKPRAQAAAHKVHRS
jgi:aspartate/glutamate racemase